MLAAAPARHYIVSSNGDTFHHPDDVALARTLAGRAAEPDAVVQLPQRAHGALG